MMNAKNNQPDSTPIDYEDDGDRTPPTDAGAERSAEDAVDETIALIEQLTQERDDAVAARQRALADYANYQRRSAENERRARTEGRVRVLRDFVEILDHVDRALEQDPQKVTAEQLIQGVRLMRDELMKAMEANGVMRIIPARGDEFDPNRHQAMLRQPDDDVAPGHIVAVFSPGYATPDQVIRPAKVAVAPGDE